MAEIDDEAGPGVPGPRGAARQPAVRAAGLRREILVGIVLLIALGLTLAGFGALQERIWLLLALWTAIATTGVALLRRPALRTPLLSAAAVLATLTAAESALPLFERPAAVFVREGECWTPAFSARRDPYLAGFGPQEEAAVKCQKSRNGELIFDVVYSFDEHNLRKTPGDPQGETVLFFGCSFTFGHGVEDAQTVPYLVSQALDWRYNVVNLGSTGTGPHHMLKVLEDGLPQKLIGGKVRRVFYTAILDHVYRSGFRALGSDLQYARNRNGEAQLVRTTPLLPVELPSELQHSRLAR